jgi:peptidoglycan/xylan/chitin deacetylase (PgdA/CDA1 family)
MMEYNATMFRTIVYLLTLSFAAALVAGDEVAPYIRFARFRGDARCAVSLTFDDALSSQLDKAVPILDRHGIHATFFILTANGKKNWARWKGVGESGHELGGHSQTHPQLSRVNDPRWVRRAIDGCAAVIEHNTGGRPLSFAYPFSDVDDVLRRKVRSVYFVDRDSCRMWGGEGFTARDGIANIEQAARKREWFFCMMHGVDDDSFKAMPSDALDGIAEYLAAHRDTIWTDTYLSVALYMKEVRVARLKLKDVREGGFSLRLRIPSGTKYADRMLIPLTLMIARKSNTERIKAYSGDSPVKITVSRDGQYFLMDVVPDGEWVDIYRVVR